MFKELNVVWNERKKERSNFFGSSKHAPIIFAAEDFSRMPATTTTTTATTTAAAATAAIKPSYFSQ